MKGGEEEEEQGGSANKMSQDTEETFNDGVKNVFEPNSAVYEQASLYQLGDTQTRQTITNTLPDDNRTNEAGRPFGSLAMTEADTEASGQTSTRAGMQGNLVYFPPVDANLLQLAFSEE